MKKTILSLSIATAIMGFAFGASAQSFATDGTATSTGTIIVPITITKVTDMNFGIAVSGTGAGSVILDPSGSRSRTGGVTFIPTTGTVTAATYTVTGEPGYGYGVTIPGAPITLTSATSATMTASSFTSNPSGTAGMLTGGTETLGVGATLNVATVQASGVYVSSAFNVTVTYN